MGEISQGIWIITHVIDLETAIYYRSSDKAKPCQCEKV
jgi:hypothetical protein